MRFAFFVLSFICVTLLVSCDPDPQEDKTGTIVFRFKAVYGDKPIKMFDTYTYPESNWPLYFTRLSFYISDLTIRSGEGDYNLKDLDYLNLTNSHTDKSNDNGFEYKISGVQIGEYSSLDFGVGVPAILNALKPKDFKPQHILSSSSEYWSAWKSYIFFRPEGKIDFGNGDSDNFALHLGADESFIEIKMNKSIKVQQGIETPVDIIIDMRKFFHSNTLFDIQSTKQIHSLSEVRQMSQLADNLKESFR